MPNSQKKMNKVKKQHVDKNRDGKKLVKIILSYISYYRDNDKVLNLVAELYGILKPDRKIPGISFYMYLFDTISNYAKILQREGITLEDSNIENFTISEIENMKISPITLSFWHNSDEFYTLTKYLLNNDDYGKFIIACTQHNVKKIIEGLQDYLFSNFQFIYTSEGVSKIYNLANWAIRFNKYDNFEQIMSHIHLRDIDQLSILGNITNLISNSFLSEEVDFLIFLGDPKNWLNDYSEKNPNFDEKYFMDIKQYSASRYICSFNDNKIFLDYLVETYPELLGNSLTKMVKFHYRKEIWYKGLDNKTSRKYLRKFSKLIHLNNGKEIEKCKKVLEEIIEENINWNVKSPKDINNGKYYNYHNKDFYIDCYRKLKNY